MKISLMAEKKLWEQSDSRVEKQEKVVEVQVKLTRMKIVEQSMGKVWMWQLRFF
jgi:hypothetical protein